MFRLIVNGRQYQVDVPSDTPLLWVLREHLGLLGTKYGCGEGLCGCCTVHLEGERILSCTMPVDFVDGRRITTIEGIAKGSNHPLIQAWLEENVSQCGFCQPGQIMTAAALLARNPNPSDKEIISAMDGNLCRCGTYQRIRNAIHRASRLLRASPRPPVEPVA